ncbi:MAG: nicotinamide-nucleotide amidohydrolase family protein, partial [Bacteroidota bacterium]
DDGKIVVSMPGVPYEMRRLVRNEVIPRLQRAEAGLLRQRSLTILTAGAGESTIAAQIAEVEDLLPEHMSLAYLPNLGTVRLRLTTRGEDEETLQDELTYYRQKIEAIIGDLVYGYGNTNLAGVVQERMQEAGLTLATAESCTGGSVAAAITAEAGSSGHFQGSVVAYDNAVKKSLLGVPLGLLKKHGAVSEAVVGRMAEGACKRLNVDYAIATSGIAGPGGGTEEKPVGTIWIAVSGPDGTRTKLLRAGKDRKRNVTYTVHQALDFLRRVLQGVEKP